MTDEDVMAIEGCRRQFRELADGTLRVQVDIEPRFKRDFYRLFPEPDLPMAMAPLGSEATTAPVKEKSDWGREAKILRQSGFLRSPTVWRMLGTDDDFLEWLRSQRCKRCGFKPRWEMDTWVGCEAAHRRRADNAGTSIKPPFSAISLCHQCHKTQHGVGESGVGGQDWFDRTWMRQIQDWGWQRLKDQLGVESMKYAPPRDVAAWADRNNVLHELPPEYREAL